MKHPLHRTLTLLVLLLLMPLSLWAQMVEPVHVKSQLVKVSPTEADIVFDATIDNGWHVYSTDLGDDGPISATFNVVQTTGVTPVGKLTAKGKEIKKFDNMFGMELRYFEEEVTFVQRVRFVQPDYSIECYVEYGACDDASCLPPSQATFRQSGTWQLPKSDPLSQAQADSVALTDSLAQVHKAQAAAREHALASADFALTTDTWRPVVDQMSQFDGQQPVSDVPLWQILLEGLLGGLVAIFTPCVWPIIPLTVSFFLKRNTNRRKAVREALLYGASIVVIYVTLGLVVTLATSANQLNALSTNAIFNILLFLLLVVFAASFFGAFEITLPASWADKVESHKGKATGLVAIFLMAFTLALVSFSCTGPIIGFLLVAVSTQGSILAPAVGLLGFALALAIPFTLFALFPSLLKSAPRSGGWMNVVKVTLGFIELAFALKFLSVADMAYGWHLLDREVFLALWIVIFGLLGAYHLGWLRFQSDDPDRAVSVGRFFLGAVSLSFAMWMVPGLWGAPLKTIGAFLPPMATQDFRLDRQSVEAHYDDYDQAIAASRAEGKPLLLDFTGYGCVNCRKMEAAVWTDPTVKAIIEDDMILVSLYTDDKTPLSEPIEVSEGGTLRTLRTVGDKWSYLQRNKFGANTQPFYVVVDSTGTPLSGSRSYDEDVQAYVQFLKNALK